MNDANKELDSYTLGLIAELFSDAPKKKTPSLEVMTELRHISADADREERTQPILDLFSKLLQLKRINGWSPSDIGISQNTLAHLAKRHETIDEHRVSLGGRLQRALSIINDANRRVDDYIVGQKTEAPTGIELWDQIQNNGFRIRKALDMTEEEWNSYRGQLSHAIDDVAALAKVIEAPVPVIREVERVTKTYRMRLTPYYASLIRPHVINDPVLLQCVPTSEMIDNVGQELPPVAADHSPARLIDQFYPRVVTIKSTNMCAMYCTHCLRIAHIGKKDFTYPKVAYEEALAYIQENPLIRDVLITGGDAFMLSNETIRWLLQQLDSIDHVRVKRLGTRVPVTLPMRIEAPLLEILAKSNAVKPIRIATQINTAQEITPISKAAFYRLSQSVTAILNQAVLLRGVNDTRTKMWRVCETMQESYVRPYYLFNCSCRNPQFTHLRVPVEVGRDIIESMYGNISGDAIPRYIATAGGKIPLHRDNVVERGENTLLLRKPWSGETVSYPDADASIYELDAFAFRKSQ
jgi:KamA family protein